MHSFCPLHQRQKLPFLVTSFLKFCYNEKKKLSQKFYKNQASLDKAICSVCFCSAPSPYNHPELLMVNSVVFRTMSMCLLCLLLTYAALVFDVLVKGASNLTLQGSFFEDFTTSVLRAPNFTQSLP